MLRPRGSVALGLRRRAEQREVLAEVQRHASARAPQRARAQPHQLAAGAERIQPRRRVAAEAARQHVALPNVGCQREALQRHELLAQALDRGGVAGRSTRVTIHSLPGRQEGSEGALVGRLDLLAQHRQRGAAQAAQHVRVAPLALAAPTAR